jgi:hypothetical protein
MQALTMSIGSMLMASLIWAPHSGVARPAFDLAGRSILDDARTWRGGWICAVRLRTLNLPV